MPNPVCWVELTTPDLEGARSFYGRLLDWKITASPSAKVPYYMVDPGGPPTAGMMGLPAPEAPVAWLAYVLVEDIEAVCAKTVELDGQVFKAKAKVPGAGWYAIIKDPQGAYLGLWQNK